MLIFQHRLNSRIVARLGRHQDPPDLGLEGEAQPPIQFAHPRVLGLTLIFDPERTLPTCQRL
jgi:hypothetical protein